MNRQSFITFLLTILMSMLSAKTFAHDIAVVNDKGVTIYYKWINNKTELAVSFQGSTRSSFSNEYSGDVVIPPSVEYNGSTYSVTSIGNEAFYDCSSLISITIPNSVTSIGDYAFLNCSSLTSLTIPNSVTAIGGAAFYDCSSLSSVVFPNNISVIRTLSFSGCNNLSTFTVPNSVTRIDRSAFAGCSSLTKIYIGNGVKCICDCAFTDCPELKDVYCLVESILPTDYFSDYEGDLSRGGELDISDGIDYTYVSGGGLYTWTSAFNGVVYQKRNASCSSCRNRSVHEHSPLERLQEFCRHR